MLIDTHCHLNFHAFKNDVGEVIKHATEEGVEKIIIPGAKIDSSEKSIEVATKYPNCFAAVGVHPYHVDEVLKYQGIKVLKNKLEELVKNKKVVAIGEIGLDYHKYQITPTKEYEITESVTRDQEELFRMQIEVAINVGLPIIFHCRDAFDDMLKIISLYSSSEARSSRPAKQVSNSKLRGVVHCFGGNVSDLEKVLGLGFYIGFDGNITYKNAENLRSLVRLTPLDRLLAETDAPFLAPEPHRGKRNEPKNAKIIARWIAELKNLSLEKIVQITTQNAEKLFSI